MPQPHHHPQQSAQNSAPDGAADSAEQRRPQFTIGGAPVACLGEDIPPRVRELKPGEAYAPVLSDFLHPDRIGLKDKTKPIKGVHYDVTSRGFTHPPTGAVGNIMKLNQSHRTLADLMISHPHLTAAEMAAKVGYSSGWVTKVKETDAFKEYFHQRLRDHQALVSAKVVTEVQSAALDGIAAIRAKLDPSKRDRESLSTLVEATDVMLKALGLGHKGGPAVSVELNQTFSATQVTAPAASVATAQQVLAKLMAENTKLTEGMVAERALIDPARAELAEVVEAMPADVEGEVIYDDTSETPEGEGHTQET